MTIPGPNADGLLPGAILSTGTDAPMTADQAMELRMLAMDGLEREAFSERLTQAEAVRRINALKAKLKLMSHPPHTV